MLRNFLPDASHAKRPTKLRILKRAIPSAEVGEVRGSRYLESRGHYVAATMIVTRMSLRRKCTEGVAEGKK